MRFTNEMRKNKRHFITIQCVKGIQNDFKDDVMRIYQNILYLVANLHNVSSACTRKSQQFFLRKLLGEGGTLPPDPLTLTRALPLDSCTRALPSPRFPPFAPPEKIFWLDIVKCCFYVGAENE